MFRPHYYSELLQNLCIKYFIKIWISAVFFIYYLDFFQYVWFLSWWWNYLWLSNFEAVTCWICHSASQPFASNTPHHVFQCHCDQCLRNEAFTTHPIPTSSSPLLPVATTNTFSFKSFIHKSRLTWYVATTITAFFVVIVVVVEIF